MDSGDDDYLEESLYKEEAVDDLLEEYWFFGNLQSQKPTTMMRCYSDTCTTSSTTHDPDGQLFKDKEDSEGDGHGAVDEEAGLIRNLSLASCEEGKGCSEFYEEIQKQKGDLKESDASEKLQWPGLVRAPSLPPNIGRAEVFQQEEPGVRTPRMNVPARHVSLNLSDMRPPWHSSSKSSSLRRYRSDRYIDRTKSRKSLSDLEDEEVQGFKDLGFSFDNKDLNQNLVSILPGLQEKRPENAEHDNVRRPYLSEAWIAQSYAPPIPKWDAKGSPEDVKAHIKYWARAVATNVRQ